MNFKFKAYLKSFNKIVDIRRINFDYETGNINGVWVDISKLEMPVLFYEPVGLNRSYFLINEIELLPVSEFYLPNGYQCIHCDKIEISDIRFQIQFDPIVYGGWILIYNDDYDLCLRITKELWDTMILNADKNEIKHCYNYFHKRYFLND